MREFYRIARITALLMRLWQKMPDMRFYQMVALISKELEDAPGMQIRESTDLRSGLLDFRVQDGFNVEDSNVEEALYKLLGDVD